MPLRRRNALTIADDHAADVDAIIHDAVVMWAIRRGLLLRDNFPAGRVSRALERSNGATRGIVDDDSSGSAGAII